VWICPSIDGHLQAVGTDAAGRRQYIYHAEWTAQQSLAKHVRALALADVLPDVRKVVEAQLCRRGMPRDRALALAMRLLDHGFFRVGSEAYTRANGSFGLATLRRAHVSVRADTLDFRYVAKGGMHRRQRIVDAELARGLRPLIKREDSGRELLAWKDRSGWHDIKSSDINAFIREVTGGDFSAKDFRTWNATVLMAQALAVSRDVSSAKTSRRRAVSRGITEVAGYLGNTPAVARRSYVDPRVIDLFMDGVTVDPRVVDRSVASPGLAIHGPLEVAVRRMLQNLS
jgi:DNA topoisomerase IB